MSIIKNVLSRLTEGSIKSSISLIEDLISKQFCATLTATSDQVGFYYVMSWLKSLEFSADSKHVFYSKNEDTSFADGNYLLKWNNKLLLLTITSSSVSPFTGTVSKTVNIKLLGGRTQDISQMLDEINSKKKKEPTNVSIYIYSNWWRLAKEAPFRNPNTLFYEDELLSTITNECQVFLEKKEDYLSKGIPWRRGYILYGQPGNGKSSFVYGIATQLKLPIYIINSTQIEKLNDMMLGIEDRAIILIEEIDTVTVNRDTPDIPTPTADNPSLSTHKVFGSFLNALDGLIAKEGILVFATTNYLEKLDKALVRPGRFDRLVEIKNCTPDLASRMFNLHFPDSDPDNFAAMFENNDLSVSHAQELLLKMNLDKEQ